MIERDEQFVGGVGQVMGAASVDDGGEVFENKLRPKSLGDFVGQGDLLAALGIAIVAAKKRGEALDHSLFHGPPGLGKTTLANIVAKEMGVSIKTTSGPALEKQGDLAAIITNLKDGDILFIDEIHRLRPPVEEILYSAMEDFAIDIILGKGPAARSMRLPLPQFTLVGATTKLSSLSSPLRDRFGNLFKLQHYRDSEIQTIVVRAGRLLGCEVEEGAAGLIAACSRCTPRIANRLLKRVRDYAEVHGGEKEGQKVEEERKMVERGKRGIVGGGKLIDGEIVKRALGELGVDGLGLEEMDRIIIRTIIEKFDGGPVGLNTIAAAVAEEEGTIEDVYEPYLIRLGLLERTNRGRVVTRKGFEHLGIDM